MWLALTSSSIQTFWMTIICIMVSKQRTYINFINKLEVNIVSHNIRCERPVQSEILKQNTCCFNIVDGRQLLRNQHAYWVPFVGQVMKGEREWCQQRRKVIYQLIIGAFSDCVVIQLGRKLIYICNKEIRLGERRLSFTLHSIVKYEDAVSRKIDVWHGLAYMIKYIPVSEARMCYVGCTRASLF